MALQTNIWSEFDRSLQTETLRPLLRRIDDIFSDFFQGQEPVSVATSAPVNAFNPPLHVEETPERYLLSVDLPGVAREDLNIEVQAGRLLISGERKCQHEQKSASSYASQRLYGTFQRTVGLPDGVQADQLEAHYKDGVLSVAIPKPATLKATKVKIGEGHAGFFKSLLGDKGTKSEHEPVKLAN